MAIDSHVHLDDPRLDWPREAARAREAGIEGALIPGYGPSRWAVQGDRLRSPDPLRLWAGFGLHPWAIEPEWEASHCLDLLNQGWQEHALSWGDQLRAVGEFGLDRSRAGQRVPWEVQWAVLDWHLARAQESGLPVILHLVRAHGAALERLGSGTWRGVIHGFQGPAELVEPYLRCGLHLSFGRAVQRSQAACRALTRVPWDRLLLETDAPGPGVAGPADLYRIAQTASQVLGKSVEYVLARHQENCRRLFGLDLSPAAPTLEQSETPA